MDKDRLYNESFDPNELGQSGNPIRRIQRDKMEEERPEPTHWDVTEFDEEVYEHTTWHVGDEEQTWLKDFCVSGTSNEDVDFTSFVDE